MQIQTVMADAYVADTKLEDDTNDGDQSRSDLWNRERRWTRRSCRCLWIFVRFGPNGAPNDMWFFNTLGNANGSPRFVKVNPQGKAITCGNPTEPGCHRLFFDVNIAGSGGTTFLEYCPLKLGTQFADAVARAEYQGAPDDWLGKAGMPQMIKSRLQMLPAIG